MPSNLPPGVTEGMIPGNRPEDEWWEIFHDKIEVPNELIGAVSPENLAEAVNNNLRCLTHLYNMGFSGGRAEAHEDFAEEQRSVRERIEAWCICGAGEYQPPEMHSAECNEKNSQSPITTSPVPILDRPEGEVPDVVEITGLIPEGPDEETS